MKYAVTDLITELRQLCQQHIATAQQLQQHTDDELNRRSRPDSWSALECIEHLNLYGVFYIPAMQSAMERAAASTQTEFSCGWLGNYFAESMKPKAQLNKMKTFKDKNPINSQLSSSVVLTNFVEQQQQLLALLDQAQHRNLMVRVPTTLSSLVRLRLGDALRFVTYHNDRHMAQAQRALSETATTTA